MKPIPGTTYTIVNENTLSKVAARAYGDPTFWRRIWNANQTTLRSNDPNLIFPGEVVIIPVLPERAIPNTAKSNKDPYEIYIDLDGQEIRPMTCRIIRTIDTVVNACNFSIPWQPGVDIQLDSKIQPKSYTKSKVSIGGEQIVNGLLYTSGSSVVGGTTFNGNINTPTADIVDSTLKPPFEFNSITLDALVKKLVEPLGFTVKVLTDTGAAFDRVTANPGDKIFQFLAGLARQRGVLLSCDTDGNVTIINAKLTGTPVATLEENVTQGVTGWGINVNGRSMFNTYRATGQSPFGTDEATSQDNNVPRSRFKTVSANEATAGNIQDAADWARNKTTADALTFPLTLEDWYDPQGNLWEENKLVTIISPTMFLKDGFNFLINSVEYVLDGSGRSTVLNFVPPTLYTQGEIVEPW